MCVCNEEICITLLRTIRALQIHGTIQLFGSPACPTSGIHQCLGLSDTYVGVSAAATHFPVCSCIHLDFNCRWDFWFAPQLDLEGGIHFFSDVGVYYNIVEGQCLKALAHVMCCLIV